MRSSRRMHYVEAGFGEDDINHDRWLVSYADFMTLLMAFFVVMYSISQISEQKYRVLSETLTQAFNPTSETVPLPQEGQPVYSHTKTPVDLDGTALEDRPGNDANELPDTFVRIGEQLEQSFEPLIESELIQVKGDERWLEIELQSSVLFGSGGAELGAEAKEIINALGETLGEHDNVIRVEGFTDNVPIKTDRFASNWELSSARAAAVVRQLVDQGISPARLAAVGYGEHQPSASNDSEEGRRANRRIVLLVSTQQALRPDVVAEQQFTFAPEPEELGYTVEGTPVQGLGASARDQARLWLERMNAAIAGSEPASAAGTLVNTSVNDAESEASSEASESAPAEASAAPGLNRVELDDGGLLFTGQ